MTTFTTTVTPSVAPDATLTYHHKTEAEAEAFVNGYVAAAVATATGGNLADWHDVTLYFGSTEDKVTVVTVKVHQPAVSVDEALDALHSNPWKKA